MSLIHTESENGGTATAVTTNDWMLRILLSYLFFWPIEIELVDLVTVLGHFEFYLWTNQHNWRLTARKACPREGQAKLRETKKRAIFPNT